MLNEPISEKAYVMSNYEKVVAAYRRHKGADPMSATDKTRVLGAMARAGQLTTHGARVFFLKLEGVLPDEAHFNAPPPWVLGDPHYVSPQKLKRMVEAHDGSLGSALCS